MDTLKEYLNDIWFMFMRVNEHIVSVRIHSIWSRTYLPADDKIKIFNELGLTTDRDYVSISHETAETLAGLLTTLGITFRQSTGK